MEFFLKNSFLCRVIYVYRVAVSHLSNQNTSSRASNMYAHQLLHPCVCRCSGIGGICIWVGIYGDQVPHVLHCALVKDLRMFGCPGIGGVDCRDDALDAQLLEDLVCCIC